jgi:hypothetical protein
MVDRPDWSGGTDLVVGGDNAVVVAKTRADEVQVSAAGTIAGAAMTIDGAPVEVDPAISQMFATWPGAGVVNYAAKAVASVDAFLGTTMPAVADELRSSIADLPGSVRRGIVAELGMGLGGAAAPASDASVANLEQLFPGLARRWSGRSAQFLGRAHSVFDRIRNRVSEDEWQAAEAWFDGLSPQAAEAVLDKVARG